MNIKETIQYLFSILKFWIIVNPWEQSIRVRFGKNKKLCNPGVHFKIPYFDRFYIQSIRYRMVAMPLQTISLKDKRTLSLKLAIGYQVNNIEKLYDTLHQPETTIINSIATEVISQLSKSDDVDNLPNVLEKNVITSVDFDKYGIELIDLKIATYAFVKTYRLIQDQHWEYEGYNMDKTVT